MANITLKGAPVTTNGELPKTGSKAPNFTLVKNDLTDTSLSDFTGKNVILNIFPSIDTGICAMSVRHFNETAAAQRNTVVLCISMDLPFANKRFCGAEGIQNVVTLSCFRDEGNFQKDYGVRMMQSGMAGLNARAIVVIDESGMVKYTEMVPEIVQEPNYDKAIAAL